MIAKMIINTWIALLVMAALTLVSCHSPIYKETKKNTYATSVQIENVNKTFQKKLVPPPPLVVKQGMYVDMTPIDLKKAPAWLKNPIIIRGDQLPFSYYSRLIASGAGKNLLTRYQPGLNPQIGVSMNYAGTIKGALNTLAAKTGYVYSLQGNGVYWQSIITKTFDIGFMPGSTDYALGKSGGGGGGGGGGAGGGGQSQDFTAGGTSESSSISGKLSVWSDLEKTIHTLLSPVGKVIISESTTSVTVKDHAANVELVSQYIHNLNKNLAKQVLVKIQVLQVTLQKDFDYGIDWGLVFKAFAGSRYSLKGNFSTPVAITTANPLTFGVGGSGGPRGDAAPNYKILISALQQQGKTTIVTEPRVVCLNNQVSVIRIVNRQAYVASVQNTAGVGGGGSSSGSQNTVTSQVTPGTVSTGLSLYILPKIMKDKLYLQVNADLSILNGLNSFPPSASTGSGAASSGTLVQLPTVSQKTFNQKSVIKSGDTLILSGFKQITSQYEDEKLLNSKTLGGTGATMQNTETVILITPTILSEVTV